MMWIATVLRRGLDRSSRSGAAHAGLALRDAIQIVRAAAMASVESLEQRTLLSGSVVASLSSPDILTAGGASTTVTVHYQDDAAPIDTATVDSSDIVVAPSAGGTPLAVQGVHIDATDPSNVVATYTVAASGGAWGPQDNGAYAVTLAAGAVSDTAGTGVDAGTTSFNINIPQPDTTAPKAKIAVADITAASTDAQSITVTYTDETAINAGSIVAAGVSVEGPGAAALPVTLGSVVASSDGKTATAVYSVGAPGGSWDSTDNGAYTVQIAAGIMTDASGNAIAASSKIFQVNVAAPAPPADTSAPIASIAPVSNISTAGSASQSVTVTYTDDTGIDPSTIGVDDLSAGMSGTQLTVTGVTTSGTGRSVTAVYTLAAPGGQGGQGGAWASANNGHYAVSVQAGAVTDLAGNGVGKVSAGFDVNIIDAPPPPVPLPPIPVPPVPVPPVDLTPPVATIAAPDITTAGDSTGSVVITYADASGMDASTIDAKDISVVRAGSKSVKVIGVSTTASDDGTSLIATYTLAAPGGAWDAEDNGVYAVTVKAAQVFDNTGLAALPAGGSFTVNIIPAPLPPPVLPPTATVSPIDTITAAGGDHVTITVTYSDALAVSVASIDTGDLSIIAPDGSALTVTSVNIQPRSDSNLVTATYTVAAPGGSWASGNSGAYTVNVLPAQVIDTQGQSIAATSANFNVNIAAPPPQIDSGFSGGQPVRSDFVGEAEIAQADGKILIAGHQGQLADGSSQFVVKRFNPDGSLDASFGNGGQVVSPAGGNDAAYAIALTDAGQILVAGTHSGDFAVTRLKTNGAIDGRFGVGGQAITELGASDDTAYALAIDASGSIVAAGGTGGSFAFVRYAANGRVDGSFGQGGHTIIGSGEDVIGSVAIGADGSIVGAGASGGQVAVVRLGSSGLPDGSFGSDGVTTLPRLSTRDDLGGLDHTEGLVLQGNQILVANGQNGDFALARLNVDGSLDSTFGNGGVITTDFGGDDDADAILLQGSGEILVLGTTDADNAPRAAIAAFDANGHLDATFGDHGTYTIDAGTASNSRALHVGDLLLRAFGGVQTDGKLVVGTSDQTPNQTPAAQTSTGLRRLNVPGLGLVGQFGQVNGHHKRLTFSDGAHRITVALRGGGAGKVYFDGTNIDLQLTGTAGVLSIKANGPVTIRNIQSDGAIGSVAARSAGLSGTLSATALGNVAFGTITGTIASAGSIGNVVVMGDLNGAKVLAGANAGSDGLLDPTVDTFSAASIGNVTVHGKAASSLVAAGLDPVNGIYLDGNDQVLGDAASRIGAIRVRGGVDDSARFVASTFGKVKIPGITDPQHDMHFLTT